LKYSFLNRPVFVLIAVTAIFFGSCRENTLINSSISPSNSAIGVFDTSLGCITHTFFDDSIITSANFDGTGLSVYQALGKMTDPLFGEMTASIFMQVTPVNFTNAMYTGATIDSVFLVLPYSGFTFGDSTNTTLTQTYQAFYMQDTMSNLAPYYSYSSKSVDESNPLSDPTTVNLYHLKDSLNIDSFNRAPALRIQLKKDAFMTLLNNALSGIASSSTPVTDFNNAFKGVCIRPTSSSPLVGAMPFVRLNGSEKYSQAGIIVYYRNSSGVDTNESYYYSTSASAHINNVKKNYGSYPINALYTSTQANDSIAGVQYLPGAAIDLKIPGIKSLPKGIINKAEIQLSVLSNYNSTLFTQPARFYVMGVANATYPTGIGYNVQYEVADRYPISSTSSFAVIDGYPHDLTRNGQTVSTYTLDIPREVMASYAKGNDTLHLRVTGVGLAEDLFGTGRVVVGGGNNPNPAYRARLFVVYSAIQR
jgi:hypothetical protein